MDIISQTISQLQPGIGNQYPYLQGKSVAQLAAMARSKTLPSELQAIIANRAMGSLVKGL
jgi:hypothetical protein